MLGKYHRFSVRTKARARMKQIWCVLCKMLGGTHLLNHGLYLPHLAHATPDSFRTLEELSTNSKINLELDHPSQIPALK